MWLLFQSSYFCWLEHSCRLHEQERLSSIEADAITVTTTVTATATAENSVIIRSKASFDIDSAAATVIDIGKIISHDSAGNAVLC